MNEDLWKEAAWDGAGAAPEFAKEVATRYLEHIRQLVHAMRAAQDRITECMGKLELLGIDPAKESAGGIAPSVADGVAKLEELRDDLATRIIHDSEEIQLAHDRCMKDKITHALWLHHVQGMTWGKAGRAVDYSADHLRGKGGLKGYQAIYDELSFIEVCELIAIPDAEA